MWFGMCGIERVSYDAAGVMWCMQYLCLCGMVGFACVIWHIHMVWCMHAIWCEKSINGVCCGLCMLWFVCMCYLMCLGGRCACIWVESTCGDVLETLNTNLSFHLHAWLHQAHEKIYLSPHPLGKTTHLTSSCGSCHLSPVPDTITWLCLGQSNFRSFCCKGLNISQAKDQELERSSSLCGMGETCLSLQPALRSELSWAMFLSTSD